MSSLADIIFLLLIFFLITSRLVTQSAIPVKRPTTKQTTSVTPAARISVTGDLKYYVDGQQVTFGSLSGIISEKLVGVEDRVVVLDMNKNLSIEKLVDLYDLASDLQIELVLSADPKKK